MDTIKPKQPGKATARIRLNAHGGMFPENVDEVPTKNQNQNQNPQ
jgi:hypothetical protein